MGWGTEMKHGICEGKDYRNQCVVKEEKKLDGREEKIKKTKHKGARQDMGFDHFKWGRLELKYAAVFLSIQY